MSEECCWATTQAAGQSCCRRSGSSVLEFAFQLDRLVYTHTVGHIHTPFGLAQNSNCAGLSEAMYVKTVHAGVRTDGQTA